MFDNDIQPSGEECPKCGYGMVTRPCTEIDCEDGYYHDCGEDCTCLYPFPNTPCEDCRGFGFHKWCQSCGWDVHEKRFIGVGAESS